MIKGSVTVKTVTDKTKDLEKSLRSLGKANVYVGIPEGDVGAHKDITNPQLMYILSHGVRSKEMREEMNEYMGLTPQGMPIMRDFQEFMKNSETMSYATAYDLYIHENGSPLWHTPPRPILEPAIKHDIDKITPYMKGAAQATLSGQNPVPHLQTAGNAGQRAAQEWFVNPENHWPPNDPKTVKEKKSSRPNIDTSNLRNSITYVVEAPS